MKFSAWFAAAIWALALGGPARAELFDLGSTFTITGTNAPNNFTQTVTLDPGTTVIDGGALTLTQTFVTESSGAEWVAMDFQAPTNALIFGNASANWEINVTGITSQLVTGITGYYDLGLSCAGVSCGLETPNACWTGPGTCTIEPNPIAGIPPNSFSQVYLASFTGTGTQSHFAITADPEAAFGNSGALLASDLDEYQFGFEVTPAVTPLPAGLPLFATGLGALGLLGWRRKHKAQAVA